MPVTIKGSGGGSVTLDAGTAASDTTLTLPNVTGTVLAPASGILPAANGGTGVATPGSIGNVLFTTDGSTWSATQKIVAGTAVATTSGTSIDFTGIPSWVKRVTVMMNGVSTNGTSGMLLQIGAGSVTTTGYSSIVGTVLTSGACGTGTSTSAFYLSTQISAATTLIGSVIISLLGSNTWVCQGTAYSRTDTASYSSGSIALGGTLDRVRITTVGGTDTFDAGSINILYE
jgi:hypothetical protein